MHNKLNQQQAQMIIDSFVAGSTTFDLEKQYGVWQTSICNIVSGRTWPQCKRPKNILQIIEERKNKGRFKPGDSRHIEAPPFTCEQQDLIVGSLLGDGCIRIGSKNAAFTKIQRKDRLSYLEWMARILAPYSSGVRPVYTSEKLLGGKGGIILERQKMSKTLTAYRLDTHQHPNWTNFENKWYDKNRIKIIPEDLVLSPISLAIWYCDDGSNSASQRMATFCIQSFTLEEADFLAKKLAEFDIFPKITHVVSRYTGKKMPLLKVYGKSYDNLIEIVKPHVFWDCFLYKIEWRPALNNQTRKPMSEWKRMPRKLTEDDAKKILSLKGKKTQQEIANQFGIKQTTVSAILRGKTWKHLAR